MHIRPKLTLLVAAVISIPAFKTFSEGYLPISNLLSTVLISLAVSFVGVTIISYMIAIFSVDAAIRAGAITQNQRETDSKFPKAIELENPTENSE